MLRKTRWAIPSAEHQEECLADVQLGDLPSNFRRSKRIRQVLWNLLGNALKFTPAGGQVAIQWAYLPPRTPPKVDERIWKGDLPFSKAESGRLLFAVCDSGIGFNMTSANALFDPFTQADKTICGKYGGAGLGLALCKRLVTALGGEICCKSFGTGATFAFTMPATPSWRCDHRQSLWHGVCNAQLSCR